MTIDILSLYKRKKTSYNEYIREWNTVWWKTCDVIQKVSALVCLQQPAYIRVWP